MTIHRRWKTLPPRIYNISKFELKTLKTYIETNLANGFIQRSSSPAEAPYTYKLQLEARERDNVPDTRDDGPAEGYFIEKKSYRGNYEIWT
jgi:hypothetical protein